MTRTTTVYISIGSNLGNKRQNLQHAVFSIEKHIGEITALSPIYNTPSWGFESDDFFNACVKVESALKPEPLLDKLMLIEKNMGRERKNSDGYESRIIDLDIIYYGYEIINNDNLTIPHPRLQERRFVLKPLADVAPQFYHPIFNKDTRNLLQECRDKSKLTKLKEKLFPNRTSLFSETQFIAIEGNIGAGKTSLATKISEDFNAKLILERFADNPFLPNFYKDQARYAFPLEMSFLADRYQQYMDDTKQFDLFKNFMVSDYDIFKSLIFANVTLQKDEFDLYRKIFNFMYKEVKKPKIYVYLYQTPERLLEQIKKRGRDYEQSIDSQYLENINRGYLDFLKTYPPENQLIIDVSSLDFVNKREDYETILENIQDFALSKYD
ncbi:2-amino-4-hydroxy-6-hydroxymethyldihydropteridine diphosphokinase [Maribacter sp. MMG018]|uniref:2-amino-4-hydroxy-6- hydroxymethyldihydropteridine diphosphokinase n=1 Tax=Maribacter sp. MMG018 TaxID=2822688 RepID=UPI001B378365|nr:2-amino-4-hydroxy-6-hydroxymethyldihydropteridine diphosphokinase [Maribacter sp. MMG018]MBQ4914049.1 2-amino-4-hydroxy-6-hydroxymethyldihydropteridine diphosphokinase [Maribacter sp. MMG018]